MGWWELELKVRGRHTDRSLLSGLVFVTSRSVIYIVVQGRSSTPESRSTPCWSPTCSFTVTFADSRLCVPDPGHFFSLARAADWEFCSLSKLR